MGSGAGVAPISVVGARRQPASRSRGRRVTRPRDDGRTDGFQPGAGQRAGAAPPRRGCLGPRQGGARALDDRRSRLLRGAGPGLLGCAHPRAHPDGGDLRPQPGLELHLRRTGGAAREPLRQRPDPWLLRVRHRGVPQGLLGAPPDPQHRLLPADPQPGVARTLADQHAAVAPPLGERDLSRDERGAARRVRVRRHAPPRALLGRRRDLPRLGRAHRGGDGRGRDRRRPRRLRRGPRVARAPRPCRGGPLHGGDRVAVRAALQGELSGGGAAAAVGRLRGSARAPAAAPAALHTPRAGPRRCGRRAGGLHGDPPPLLLRGATAGGAPPRAGGGLDRGAGIPCLPVLVSPAPPPRRPDQQSAHRGGLSAPGCGRSACLRPWRGTDPPTVAAERRLLLPPGASTAPGGPRQCARRAAARRGSAPRRRGSRVAPGPPRPRALARPRRVVRAARPGRRVARDGARGHRAAGGGGRDRAVAFARRGRACVRGHRAAGAGGRERRGSLAPSASGSPTR